MPNRPTSSPVVVVIPTKDERLHIARCIESVAHLWPVVVVDSGSSDDTVHIARRANAVVLEQPWLGYAAQKNWALDNLPIESEWVLFLDADEQLTEPLRNEISEAVRTGTAGAFAVPRRYVFLGRELRYAWWYPDYQIRLFKSGQARFEERRVHEHPVVRGEVHYLKQALIHHNRKGLEPFLQRHVRYARLEAEEQLAPSAGRRRGAFSGSRADRRRALKERIWYHLPYRPAIRFWWLLLMRRGFLDGWHGVMFCRLIAHYEVLIDAMLFEQRLDRDL